MSTNSYVNLDARTLFNLASRAQAEIDDADRADLLRIAEHLQGLDDKLQRHLDGTFEAGVGFARASLTARSNVVKTGRRITNEEGETIIAAFRAEGGEVRHAKPGESGRTRERNVAVVDLAKPQKAARKGFRLQDL